MHALDSLDGAILIDKPAGPTSHDIVDAVRRHFQIKKVGHCGTLDPAATGLLVILLGKGTKLSERLMSSDKVYEGTIKFGVTTDSWDADGEIVATFPVPPLTVESLNLFAQPMQGDQLQIPPMHSAIKKDGVPLYKLARKGIEVERKPRLIRIYSFKFNSYAEPISSFRVACTKGTYVRTLAHDIGERAGCGAHLASLRRLESGAFNVSNAASLDEVLRWNHQDLQQRVIPFLQLAAQ
jgi:tRNA pseudouridine55 synthase